MAKNKPPARGSAGGDRRQHTQNKSHQKSHRRSKEKRANVKKTQLVFDPNERIDFVQGFAKRKQERRDRAKQEALVKDREMRSLLRKKRKEALSKVPTSLQGPAAPTKHLLPSLLPQPQPEKEEEEKEEGTAQKHSDEDRER